MAAQRPSHIMGMGRHPPVRKEPESYRRLADLLTQIELLIQSDVTTSWPDILLLTDVRRRIRRIDRALRAAPKFGEGDCN